MTLTEHRLWFSVILQAILDFTGQSRDVRRQNREYLQRSAQHWFMSNAYYPGSFRWVCDELGLEPQWIRRGLRRDIDISQVEREMALERWRRYQASLDEYGETQRPRWMAVR